MRCKCADTPTPGRVGPEVCPDCGGTLVAHCCEGIWIDRGPVVTRPVGDKYSVVVPAERICPVTNEPCDHDGCEENWCYREEHYP